MCQNIIRVVTRLPKILERLPIDRLGDDNMYAKSLKAVVELFAERDQINPEWFKSPDVIPPVLLVGIQDIL